MRKTKIICTIGPASEHEDVLTRMIKAGMDVARLNFSHGSHEEHQGKIDLIKKVRQKLHMPIAIMLDTKGPEYRIKTFENGKIELKDGDTFTLTTDDIVGNQERVSVNYENLIKDLKVGDRVLVANGIIILQVRELKGNNAICDVIAGGTLSDRKSMNFPNKVMKHAYLSEQDKDDLLFGIKNEVDYVAASFVSTKQDVADLRSFLDENGGEDIDIIAKIENRSGVDHVEEICEIANGIIILQVRELKGNDAICDVIAGGTLSDRKSMNFPNKVMKHAYLSKQDKEDLLFGIKNEVDYVAASFVSTKQDVADLRSFLDENGGEDIDIIAKIENRSGVDHVEEICEIANGIMIARGDLGVEIPGVEVPAIQKYLINKCRMLGTRVITATEMLESMIHNPRPTRAELSDVANAVYDGSSAIMLSGESAAGKYPVEAVKNMAETAEYTEKQINYGKRFANADFQTKSIVDAISHATCAMAIDVDAKCIVVSSLTGRTVRMVSRFRCPVDIIGMTTSEKAWRKLNLSWGVKPVLCEEYNSMEVMFYNAMNEAKSVMKLKKGDHIVLTGGLINGKTGNTNVIKVETV